MTQCQRQVWTPTSMRRMTNFKHRLFLFYSGRDQVRWNICLPAMSAIVSNIVPQGICTPKGQTTETVSWELFFDSAMSESIIDFTSIRMDLLGYLFQRDRDTKETDVMEIRALFGLLYMAGKMCVSCMNIDDFHRTDGTGVSSSNLLRQKIWFLLRALRFDNVNT